MRKIFSHKRTVILVSGLTAAILLLTLMPLGIRYGILRVLHEKGAEQASLKDVDFNPFTGRLVLYDLDVKKGNAAPLHISELNVRISWRELFRKRVYIEELSLTQSSLSIAQLSEGVWSIGGIAIAPSAEKENDESKSSPWGFGAGKVTVKSFSIYFRGMDLELPLNIQHLDLLDLKSWEPGVPARINFAGLLLEGGISLNARVRPFAEAPDLKGTIEVENLNLTPFAPLLPPGVQGVEGILKLTSALEAGINEESGIVVTHQGAVSLLKTGFQSDPFQVQSGGITWTGTFNYREKNEDDNFNVHGDLVIEDLSVINPSEGLAILALEKLVLSQAAVEGLKNIRTSKIKVKNIEIAKHTNVTTPEANTEPLFQSDEVEVSDIALTNADSLSVELIDLKGPKVLLRRTPDGTWHLIEDIMKITGPDKPDTNAVEKKGRPLKIHIGALRVGGDAGVRFEDESVEPPYRTKLVLNSVDVRRIDNSGPDNISPFSIEGKIGDYSVLQFSGDIRPFADKPTMQVTGKIEELDLHPLSSYSGSFIGYTMDSGHLSSEIDIKIESGNIDANNSLVLQKLRMSPKDKNKIKEIASRLTVSVESALSLLREGDGSIRFNLPVTGDISDPKIGFGDIMNRALVGAMKQAAFKYLKHALQPYGTLITVIQFAGKAARIRLDPLEFAPGANTLDPGASGYLETVAKLMKERPGIQVSLCAKASPNDITVLSERAAEALKGQAPPDRPGAVTAEKEQKEKSAPMLTDEQILTFAGERALIIKKRLTEQYGIESGRLFICNPEIDNAENAKPRVDLII